LSRSCYIGYFENNNAPTICCDNVRLLFRDYYSIIILKERKCAREDRCSVYTILEIMFHPVGASIFWFFSNTEEENARASPAAKQSLSILVILDTKKRSINVTVRVFKAASLSTTVFHLRVHPVF